MSFTAALMQKMAIMACNFAQKASTICENMRNGYRVCMVCLYYWRHANIKAINYNVSNRKTPIFMRSIRERCAVLGSVQHGTTISTGKFENPRLAWLFLALPRSGGYDSRWPHYPIFLSFQLLHTIKSLVLPSEGRNNVRKLFSLTKNLILKIMISHSKGENFG